MAIRDWEMQVETQRGLAWRWMWRQQVSEAPLEQERSI
jgi:hypothetical protein